MSNDVRLIEVAFPLKQASLDSVHEKMSHSGHIKAIHIWPARRPLAASRAALIATLLPDPGNTEARKQLVNRIGGTLTEKVKRKRLPDGTVEEKLTEETTGGILHWGRESNADIEWFRSEIRKAHDGRIPRVLDPFSGGGAIPLEAMRLGCEATAVDINSVAWFILKATLDYPQRLSGQTHRLPDFIRGDHEFMQDFFKAKGLKGAALRRQLELIGLRDEHAPQFHGFDEPVSMEADLSWHVRAWGRWILQQAVREIGQVYPVSDGQTSLAYLWARTVKCKHCRATVPLLKSRWIRRKDRHRVLLNFKPNAAETGVDFEIQNNVPVEGTTTAQRSAHDKRIGFATMSRSGATCPCCKNINTMEDLRLEGIAGNIGMVMTAVVVEGKDGKEYRLPDKLDEEAVTFAEKNFAEIFADIPFGLPTEPLPGKEALGFRVPLYGFDQWVKLFTPRQLCVMGTLVRHVRRIRQFAVTYEYSPDWLDALQIYLACVIDKIADYNSALVQWQPPGGKGGHTFTRWAVPMTWDFVENNIFQSDSGGVVAVTDWVAVPIGGSLAVAAKNAPRPNVIRSSALELVSIRKPDRITFSVCMIACDA